LTLFKSKMQFKILVFLALASLALADQRYIAYQKKFGKSFNSPREFATRQSIFLNNLKNIQDHNAKYAQGEVSWQMGVNQFTDMTEEEMAAYSGLPKIPEGTKTSPESLAWLKELTAQNVEPKASLNWVEKGMGTSVKNQGQCGSCTAFAVTATIESCFLQQGGRAEDLSEQFLVSCANDYSVVVDGSSFGAYGCQGAWPQAYYDYLIKKAGGQHQYEFYYPYTATDSECTVETEGFLIEHKVTDQASVWQGDATEETLLRMLQNGPVATTIDASYLGSYSTGVLETSRCCDGNEGSSCTSKNNHAVTVVGYGFDENLGKDYWLIKNSWGDWFGENGYFRIVRGKGHCGVGSQCNNMPTCK
jgi:cathepsin L